MRHRQEDVARADELLASLGFEITHYDACGELDLTGWWTCLQYRSMLRAAFQIPHKSDDKSTGIIQVKTPYLESAVTRIFRAVQQYRFLREMADKELMARRIDDRAARAVIEEARRDNPDGDWTAPEATLQPVFRALFRSPCAIVDKIWCADDLDLPPQWDPNGTSQFLRRQFYADFRLPEDVLLRQFRTWMHAQKKDIESTGVRSDTKFRFPSVKYTDANVIKWHRFRLLACVDLRMMEDAYGLPLTHERIGNLLFPGTETDSDRTRRTVVRLADEMMSLAALQSLTAQVESTFQQPNSAR